MQTQTNTGIEIDSRESLRRAIEKLEAQQKEALQALKGDLDDAYQSLKPANIVKTLVSEIFHSPEIKEDVLQSAVGYGAGWLANRFVSGENPGFVKRAIAHLAQVGITNIVNGHSDEIRSKSTNLLGRLVKRYKRKKPEDEDRREAE
jgi:hypothetical protein